MNETFGERLARLRRQRNLTQEEIGEQVSVSAQAVSKWENDISYPDVPTLVILADILDVSLDTLLGKEKEEKTTPSIVPLENRKDFNSMMLKIKVFSSNGDRININLPMLIVKMALDMGMSMPEFNGNDILKSVDLQNIITLVEQGVIGEIITITSADGDKVSITVE